MPEMKGVVWLSLDPVHCRIDFYPGFFAQKIETAFSNKEDNCVLGKDFFNATVHVGDVEMYQTTPGEYLARNFKQPGYRTVARVTCDTSNVFGKRVYGEWRMCREEHAERTFKLIIPSECVIGGCETYSAPRTWVASDLYSDCDTEDALIIWQWCKKTEHSPDDSWFP